MFIRGIFGSFKAESGIVGLSNVCFRTLLSFGKRTEWSLFGSWERSPTLMRNLIDHISSMWFTIECILKDRVPNDLMTS